ncbi:MAG: alpha/beta hydrolase, partial [Candidatus Binatia bacterium]
PDRDHSDLRARVGEPLSVPTTSIFSRTDGVVAWRSCLDEESGSCQNIEIVSSHIGMGHHPIALAIIADRLAQPEGSFAPFRPGFWTRLGVVTS